MLGLRGQETWCSEAPHACVFHLQADTPAHADTLRLPPDNQFVEGPGKEWLAEEMRKIDELRCLAPNSESLRVLGDCETINIQRLELKEQVAMAGHLLLHTKLHQR